MAIPTAQARQQLLDVLAGAAEQLGFALAALSEAYEQLDEYAAERLEEQLFRPVQSAYGRAQRTHAGFAERCELPSRTFEPQSPGAPSNGPKGFIDLAVDAASKANNALAGLQDSMLPVEVGDAELRAGIAEVRVLIDDLRARAHELIRTLGR
jgi:hypothetical protein